MNRYPEWWNTTITVYNKYEDPATRKISWYRTVLHNCFWKYTGNKLVVGETVIETNTTLCRIPAQPEFLARHIWNNTEDKSSYFTLGTGDIIVKGEVEEEIDEYASDYRSSDILTKYKKYGECMCIEQCADLSGDGRNPEHYYVRGV